MKIDTSKRISLPCYTKDGKLYEVYCVYDATEIKSFRIVEEYTKSNGEKEFKSARYIPPDTDVLEIISMVIYRVLDEISKEKG